MRLKRLFLLTIPLLAFASASAAQTKSFDQAELEKIVAELDPAIPHNPKFTYPIKCTLVAKDDVNAYATATREGSDMRATMVVFTGLAKATGGDERLIRACVAHELSHLSRGHMVDVDPAARDLRNLWTRQQEFEADKYGAEALVKTGHSKKDMVDLLLFLDRDSGREGGWLQRLTGDHADPKARAAEISDDPQALRSLILFDTALAYEDAREHLYAQKLFEASVSGWPQLTEAYTNSAKCALMYYYDNLPKAVRAAWWRPDFGPLITNPHASAAQATEVTDQDREAWKDSLTAANLAVDKNAGSVEAQEILALTQVLEPDAKKEVVQTGIAWFKSHAASESDDVAKLRYANNAGVGYKRLDDLDSAYNTIMAAQKGTTKFNFALGENLGLVTVKGRSKEDDLLAANVLYTWLGNTPGNSPRWNVVKKTFDDICATAGLQTKEIPQKPAYLCQVTTLVTSGKRLGLLLPVSGLEGVMGAADKSGKYDDRWPDLRELRWNSGLTIMTERGKVMRLTSSEPGAYLVLKPRDTTSQDEYAIKVGMTKVDLFGMINEKASVMKDLADGGAVKSWNYFSDLGMGVLIEGDKVTAITVTPVVYEG